MQTQTQTGGFWQPLLRVGRGEEEAAEGPGGGRREEGPELSPILVGYCK